MVPMVDVETMIDHHVWNSKKRSGELQLTTRFSYSLSVNRIADCQAQ